MTCFPNKWIKKWQPSVNELEVMRDFQDDEYVIDRTPVSEPSLMDNVPKITNRDCSTTDFYQWQSTFDVTFGNKNNKNHVRLVESISLVYLKLK